MDATHLHLLLNHFPIIGSCIAFFVLLYALITRNDSIRVLASYMFVVFALSTFIVMNTGESAEETVENLPGVSESFIEQHEEAAEWAFWLMEATGLSALLSLLFHWKKAPSFRNFSNLTFLLSLFAFSAMARTGYLGGQIRHSEIRGNSAAGQMEGVGAPEAEGEADDD